LTLKTFSGYTKLKKAEVIEKLAKEIEKNSQKRKRFQLFLEAKKKEEEKDDQVLEYLEKERKLCSKAIYNWVLSLKKDHLLSASGDYNSLTVRVVSTTKKEIVTESVPNFGEQPLQIIFKIKKSFFKKTEAAEHTYVATYQLYTIKLAIPLMNDPCWKPYGNEKERKFINAFETEETDNWKWVFAFRYSIEMAIKTLLLIHKRADNPISRLPKEILLVILKFLANGNRFNVALMNQANEKKIDPYDFLYLKPSMSESDSEEKEIETKKRKLL